MAPIPTATLKVDPAKRGGGLTLWAGGKAARCREQILAFVVWAFGRELASRQGGSSAVDPYVVIGGHATLVEGQ